MNSLKLLTNNFSGAFLTSNGLLTTKVLGWRVSRICVFVIYVISKGGSCLNKITSSSDKSFVISSERVTWSRRES